MRSALIELSAITHLTQPLNRLAHWVARRAGNDAPVAASSEVDISELKLLVRPRLGKVRKLATQASNSDRMAVSLAAADARSEPPSTLLQLASHNAHVRAARSLARPALRVVLKPDAAGGSGRMVISGRMADVCAELDRLAHQHEGLMAQALR